MSDDNAALPTRPRVRDLLTLALPIIISRATQVVVGVTDAAMAGRLSEDALAAVTTGSTNVFNIFILPMGLAFIVQTFASQLVGKGDAAGARRFAWYGLVVAALTVVASVVAIPFVPAFFALFDYTPPVRDLIVTFSSVRLLSGGAVVGIEALGAYYGALGNTRLQMVAQIIAMVLNVALNWVLIYGHLGAPPLGVLGSALASTIATTTGFVFLFVCFYKGIGTTARAPAGRLHLQEFIEVLKVGLPTGANWFIEFAAFSFFLNVVVVGLGTATTAALMAVVQLSSIAFMPAFGLASAGAIFVGQAIGAKKHDDVPRTVAMTAGIAAVWMSFVGVTYLVAPMPFLRAFLADGDAQQAAAFLAIGANMLRISSLWQLFDALGMALSEALRAAGDTAFTFWARSAIAWCIWVPGAWATIRWFGGREVAAMLWFAGYVAVLAIVLFVRFRGGRWRTLDVTAVITPTSGA